VAEKSTLAQYVPDVMAHPWIAKVVATVTTAAGASTFLGILQTTAGIVASTLGAMLTYAILKKVRLETELHRKETELRMEEAELRIAALKKDAAEYNRTDVWRQ